MTRKERIRAFRMRVDGMLWEDIAAALGYSESTVRGDLYRCLKDRPREPKIPWCGLREYVKKYCQGSVKQLALQCGIKPNTLYYYCSVGKMPEASKKAIAEATGRPYRELFTRGDTRGNT